MKENEISNFLIFFYTKKMEECAPALKSLSRITVELTEPYDRVYVLTRTTLNAQKLPQSLLNVLRGCRK